MLPRQILPNSNIIARYSVRGFIESSELGVEQIALTPFVPLKGGCLAR